MNRATVSLLGALVVGFAGGASGHAWAEEPGHSPSVVDVVMDHITDSRVIEFQNPLGRGKFEFEFPEWKVQVGNHTLDLTPTKHVFWMWVACALLLLVVFAAMAGAKAGEVHTGLGNILETFVLFIRDEIALPNMGEHAGEAYTPYLCTIFFFVLFCGLLGVLPFAATATGNIAVTATLALLTFALTQVAGMRGQGVIGYWTHLVPPGVPWWLYPIVLPVELLGLVTKPFALTVRLFANMIAGHLVILFLLGIIFIVGSALVAPISVAFALGIYLLELVVILIQAYIFTLLSATFIGMAAHPH